MKAGWIAIFVSGIYSLFLLVRIKSILGVKFLILSGSNIFNAKGIQLSDGGFFLLWLIALAGFCVGAWLVYQGSQSAQAGR